VRIIQDPIVQALGRTRECARLTGQDEELTMRARNAYDKNQTLVSVIERAGLFRHGFNFAELILSINVAREYATRAYSVWKYKKYNVKWPIIKKAQGGQLTQEQDDEQAEEQRVAELHRQRAKGEIDAFVAHLRTNIAMEFLRNGGWVRSYISQVYYAELDLCMSIYYVLTDRSFQRSVSVTVLFSRS
jgi:hypothetical protein